MIVDDYAAGIVRRIFDLRKSGTSTSKITAMLNQERILPPLAYWYQQNGKTGKRSSSTWSTVVVSEILRNEVYLGNLVMNHFGSRSYKDSAMIKKPASEWVRCDGAHEAIISQAVWDAVQAVNANAAQRFSGRAAPSHYLFSGKLVCADCKGPLVASKERSRFQNGTCKEYVSYHCGRHSGSGFSECSRHTIYELSLSKIVIAEIQRHAQAVSVDETAVIETLKNRISGYDKEHITIVKQEISRLHRRVQELEELTAKLYEDKYSGSISESTFIMLVQKNEQERLEKSERLDTLLAEVDGAEMKIAAIHNWAAVIRKYLNLRELDRTVIDELIEHIEIGERFIENGQRQQSIKVFYRFVGMIG